MSTARATRFDQPSAPPVDGEAATLAVVAAATALVLVIFTTPLTTLGPTALALGASAGQEAWLLSAMPMGAAAGLLGAGALGDSRGRRIVFLWGLAIMCAGSALAAMAPAPVVIIAARVAQGIGGAAVIACGLGLLGAVIPPGPARTRATGIWAAGLGCGVAGGPIIAALFTRLGGWPAAYWGTGVLAFALFLAGRAVLPADEAPSARRVDVLGSVLLMVAVTLLMAGLTDMRLGLFRPTVFGLLGSGVVVLAGFVAFEARHRNPILDMALFRQADFSAATFAAFASGAGILALMTLVPTLLARAMEREALTAAFVLCAWSATSVVTALGARWLPEGWSPRVMMAAGLMACAAAQLLLLGPRPDGTVAQLLPGLFLAGAANGILNAALGRQAVATVPRNRTGMGSGANNTARYLGSAIGITVGAVLMAHGAEASGTAGVLTGWDEAVFVTTGFSVLGAVVVAVTRN